MGVVTLAKTWCTNLMIAVQKLKMLNKLNIWSTATSFIFIFFIPKYGLSIAVLLVTSQPVIFIISALWLNPELRPSGFLFSKRILRKLMLFGFVPFLAGILVKTDDQVERWGIINILGIENFGKYNLVLIYCSVFMLVPASINPIFFPKAILQYKDNRFDELKKTIRLYIATLMGYAVVTIIVTIVCLPVVINKFLPKYNIGVPYVWYILPYLTAQIMVMPLDFIYTLTAKFRVMFASYIMSVLLFIILIFVISNLAQKRLEYFAIAKSFDGLVFVLCSSLGYYFFLRKTFLKKE